MRRRQKCYRQNTHWNRNTIFAHGNMLSSFEFLLMFPHPKHMCVSSRWELSSVFVTWAKYILCCYCSLKSTRYTYGLECVNSMSTLRIWARTKYETLVAVCSSDGTGQKHRSQSNIRLATTMATIFFFFSCVHFFSSTIVKLKQWNAIFSNFFQLFFFRLHDKITATFMRWLDQWFVQYIFFLLDWPLIYFHVMRYTLTCTNTDGIKQTKSWNCVRNF